MSYSSLLRHTLSSDLSRPVRGERRVNCVLAAVREFFRHTVSAGLAGPGTLRALFEVADERSLPTEARGEGLADARLRLRHRLREPERWVGAISDEDVLELLRACRKRAGPVHRAGAVADGTAARRASGSDP